MIGWICSSTTPYYDIRNGCNAFKQRPVLIIGGLLNNDYTVLPISTVSKRENLHPLYDIEINPMYYPRLNLNKVSFVRVHKQTTVHRSAVIYQISDLRNEYPNLYWNILEMLSRYNKALEGKAK